MLPANETDTAITCALLHDLNFPIHRLGYSHLILAVIRYAQGDMPSLTKELYPYVAKRFGYSDWHAIERAIRSATADAWTNRDPQIWELYFPRCRKAPSNKRLIATLAEQLRQNTPPVSGRGRIVRKMSVQLRSAPNEMKSYSLSGSV